MMMPVVVVVVVAKTFQSQLLLEQVSAAQLLLAAVVPRAPALKAAARDGESGLYQLDLTGTGADDGSMRAVAGLLAGACSAVGRKSSQADQHATSSIAMCVSASVRVRASLTASVANVFFF